MNLDLAETVLFDYDLERYPLHEELANRILEDGLASNFDLALSWEAPLDHAFLSPVNTMLGTRPIPPLVPIWINCFVAPQPTARRCFAFGQHIARVVAKSPWNVGIIATGGLSHFPELSLPRVGETDTVFDRKLIHWMESGEHEPLLDLTEDAEVGVAVRAATGPPPPTGCFRGSNRDTSHADSCQAARRARPRAGRR